MLMKGVTLYCILKQRVPFAGVALRGIYYGKKISG